MVPFPGLILFAVRSVAKAEKHENSFKTVIGASREIKKEFVEIIHYRFCKSLIKEGKV